jgi:hypothetical protein
MRFGVGVVVPVGRNPARSVHHELIGNSMLDLVSTRRRGSLAYVLTVNGMEVGCWMGLNPQADAMPVLQQWRGYLYHGGTVEAWASQP